MTPEERAADAARRRRAAGAPTPAVAGRNSPSGGNDGVVERLGGAVNIATGGLKSLLDFAIEPTSPGGHSRAESFGAGAEDTLTLGNAGPYRAGVEAAGAGPLGYLMPGAQLMGGVNAVSNFINPGNPLIDSTEQSQRVDDAIQANRGSSMAGQVAGALGPGLLANAGVRGLLRISGGGINLLRQPSTFAKVANWMNNSVLGRIVTNGGIGGVEGGAYARSKEEDTVTGVGLGVLGGAAGSAIVGEAVPGIARSVSGSATQWNARAKLLERMRKAVADPETNPLGNPPPTREAEIDRLGPLATLADVDDGARRHAIGATQSADYIEHMSPLARTHEERIGRYIPGEGEQTGSIYGNFENEMTSILPRDFQRVAGPIVGEARAHDTAARNAKEYFRSLQTEFDAALDNFPFVTEEAIVRRALREAMNEGVTPTTATAAAYEDVLAKLDFQLEVARKNGIEDGLRPREMHALRTEIADMIDAEISKTQPNNRLVAELTRAKRVLSDALDEIPDFASVNQRFATEGSYMRAYELGRDQLSPTRGMSPEQARLWMDNANPGDTAGLLEGTTRQILDNMLRKGGEGNTARLLTQDDLIVKRLGELYGEEIADRIVSAANRAVHLAQTSNRLVSGSDTGRNLAEAAQFKREGLKSILDHGIVFSNIAREVFPSAPGASTGAAGGALRRILGGHVHPDEAAELSRLLSQQGPTNIRAVLDDLAAVDQAVHPKTLGGLNHQLTPPSGSLMDGIQRVDVGEVPAAVGGLTAPATVLNDRNSTNRRRRRRQRKQNANP